MWPLFKRKKSEDGFQPFEHLIPPPPMSPPLPQGGTAAVPPRGGSGEVDPGQVNWRKNVEERIAKIEVALKDLQREAMLEKGLILPEENSRILEFE